MCLAGWHEETHPQLSMTLAAGELGGRSLLASRTARRI